ncbi:hypothetical protein KY338_02305 [Candidatus Woesearchaeota archaeon]|nr:hypothetical protein [Candidatus Woesearchaeota archaeon]MBW3006123.1 hypothetical protein [Candidatus Woesearchaeota archaeon]
MKEAYAKVKKDLDLPDFDVLNNEFEIITIEPDGFLLREIKRKINEKLSSACDLLTKLIQPETTSLSDLYEYRCFDDAEKKKIFDLFCHVMYLKRKINESELLLDTKVDAAIIKEAAEVWPELRKKMIPFVKELEVCWEKTPESDKEIKEYLG